MHLLIILDFDGVLFDSSFEAYQVCESTFKGDERYRKEISFNEFLDFRSVLTDAWQFNRLYKKDRSIKDFSTLPSIEPDDDDWCFAQEFFSARKVMMEDPEWAKLMSPYPIFYQMKSLLNRYPESFRILSTRNEASIKSALDFYGVHSIKIFGQDAIREKGSKFDVARSQNWLNNETYTVYIDDMNSHLEPFQGHVDLCVHAGWGFDKSGYESYTGTQAFNLLNGLVSLEKDVKL